MSILSWGELILENTKIRGLELTNLAINVTELGIKHRIFFVFGIHMSQKHNEESSGTRGILPFELIDDPLSAVSDIFFRGDNVEIYYGADQMDSLESLENRMARLQSTFQDIFELNQVQQAILHINPGYGRSIDLVETTVGDFKSKLLELYNKNHNSISYVNLRIIK